MIREVFEYFVLSAEAELGVNCVKGYPDWARPAATPPCAALELATWGTSIPTRIGQNQTRQALGLRLWVFARHEPELAELLDSLAAWATDGEAPVVDGRRLDVRWLDGQRHVNETGSQAEAHGFWVLMAVAW